MLAAAPEPVGSTQAFTSAPLQILARMNSKNSCKAQATRWR